MTLVLKKSKFFPIRNSLLSTLFLWGILSGFLNSWLSISLGGIANIMIISYFWIDWRWETYTINPNSMTHCSGIFLRNKEFYALESIRSITVRQHLFGLLMGYGNIRLYSPFSEEPHRIKQIPNPMRTAEEIENILPDDIPIDQVGLQILSHQEHRNLQKTKTEHDTLQKNPKEIPYS